MSASTAPGGSRGLGQASLRAKTAYVAAARRLREVLAATGVLALLDRWARTSRTGLWVRSWLAVHDLEDLATLDVPWWTFEAADVVEAFLATRPQARVFEWGSGASTLWLAARAGSVVSVEHDAAWARLITPSLPDHATLLLREPTRGSARGPGIASAKPGFAGLDFTDYVAAIEGLDAPLDLIVVDGRAREACLARAVEHLRPGGLIVVDNVERARYRSAIVAVLAAARPDAPLTVRWTRGRTPALPYPTRTAVIRAAGPAR